MTNENFILVDSVDVYNKTFGLDTLHPLVSVVDLSKATKTLRRARMHYGVYALFLKHGEGCALHYGRQKYDYQDGTVVSFAPGQVVDIKFSDDDPAPEAFGLLLDYCMRYYDRQFITRHRVNSDILTRFEQHLREYFEEIQF